MNLSLTYQERTKRLKSVRIHVLLENDTSVNVGKINLYRVASLY